MLASLTLAWGNNLSFLLNGEPAALIYYWWVFFHAGLSVISVPPVGTSSSASFITPDTADVSSFQNCTLGTDGLRVHLWLYLKVWTAQSGLTRVWTSHICLPELLDTRPAGVRLRSMSGSERVLMSGPGVWAVPQLWWSSWVGMLNTGDTSQLTLFFKINELFSVCVGHLKFCQGGTWRSKVEWSQSKSRELGSRSCSRGNCSCLPARFTPGGVHILWPSKKSKRQLFWCLSWQYF